jgi:hypothetical protein
MVTQKQKYEMDITVPGGNTNYVANIRVGTLTTALVIDGVSNTSAQGAVTFPTSAKVSNHARQKGLRPTTVVLSETAAIGNYTASARVRIPLLNVAIKIAALSASSASSISYGGSTTWKVSYVEGEKVK